MKNLQDENTNLESKTDFWIENNLNVLFTGTQGVGKSTIIEQAFKKHGLRFKYFTASLIDPYLTLIGVPKEHKDEETGESVLEYIKPREFSSDADLGIEAIFFDEFNRASPAVRNSVMELIQFKSINGVRLPNLKFVWAAINPSDEEETFDVFELDPAQKDRFHVQYVLPNEPNFEYFKMKFGTHLAKSAIKWWNGLPDDIKKHVSPRRLDYGLEMYQMGGDISDTLIPDSRPDDLLRRLQDITGGEGTNLDRWMSDPQAFLDEITDENTPYEGDVIEAINDLKTYAIDMATDLVANLLPEQLREISDSELVVDLLLRNFAGPKSESIKNVLEESVWYEQHKDFIYSKVEEKTNPKFFKAYESNDLDGMKANLTSGFTYLITLMWVKENEKDLASGVDLLEMMKDFYNKEPNILKYLAQWDYALASKLFEPL